VKLASVGYEFINGLSKKFNVLYRLCEEQLSKQRHYDFGLRNILSVLRTAGNTKRKELQTKEPAALATLAVPEKKELFEEMLLMRSLRDMNLSKLVFDDIALFEGLLKDIFPRQTSVEKQVYVNVEQNIPVMLKKKPELIERPEFTLKIIQLYETSLVRHGFMLVGPTASGKTTIMTLLT
jgi:dynein heavy chain